jgi:iron complex transport system ATP-binding protein
MLTTENLEVSYGARPALRSTTIRLETGSLIALVGPNGAGKSTLLRALANLAPHRGSVSWRGTPLAKLDARARARAVAYMPQDPPVHWPLRASELVALGRLPHRAYGAEAGADDAAAVQRAMAHTDTAAFAARSVDRLSVGERARVLLARALAVEAPVLLVDEPVAMLDPYHQLAVMRALRSYSLGGGETGPRLVIAVLHDLTLAARFCARILLMDDGAIVADGPPALTLRAELVRAHYNVEPLVTEHRGEPVILPWEPLRG